MEKLLQVFDSFEEAEAADREFWASQTMSQRLEYMIQIRHSLVKEDERRIPRIIEIIEIP